MTIINTALNIGSSSVEVKKEPILDTNTDPCSQSLPASKAGSNDRLPTNILPAGNNVDASELLSVFEGTFSDADLPELSSAVYVIEGFEGTNWCVDDSTQQLYVNFPKGVITDFPRSMTVMVDPQRIYFYPYTNNEYVSGCLINYTDDGSSVTLKAYVIYNDNRESTFLLSNGNLAQASIPSGYSYAAYIKDITIPAHTLFALKPYDYQEWTQPNLIADNAYGTISSSGTYNSDYASYKAPNNSDTCWAVPNGNVGLTWWRWQFPEKLLVKSIKSRGRTNELFTECDWYTNSSKSESLCETYAQSATTDTVLCNYRELSEVYFTGYDGPNSGNPGLRNLLIEAVKGEHVWVAPTMQYTYSNPSDSIMTYTFSNFVNNNSIIAERTKNFFTRGYDAASFPKTVSNEFFTNNGCTVSGTVFTGGAGKTIALSKLIDFYTASSWEVVIDYTYNGGGSECPIMSMGLGGIDYTNFQLTVSSDNLKLYASSNNTSWDVFSGQSTDLYMSSGDNYLIKFTYNETTGYEVLYSQDDGTSWTSCFTSATTTKIRCLKPFCLLGNGYNTNSYYSNGSVDLSKCYIKVNNQYVWQAYETYTTYVSDGCLVNYTDDGSATTLKAYLVTFTNGDKDIVLSPDNTFSITGMTSSEYLRDVTVPAHSLYRYTNVKAEWSGQPILSVNGSPGGSSFAAWASSEGTVYNWETDTETTAYAYKAFDGLNDTNGEPYSPSNTWIANGSSGQWLAFYSPDELYIQSITIRNPYVYIEQWEGEIYVEGYIFLRGKLQGSTDGNTWVDLTSEFPNTAGSNESFTVNVNLESKYHYFRLYHTSGNAYPGIAEVTINALSTQKGFVKADMTYTVTANTDKPYNINFDTFAYSTDVFYEKSKLFVDFYYKSSSDTKSDGLLVNYTDDGSAVTLNAYVITYSDGYVDMVLSPDNTFTMTDVVSKELVGTVSVGAHTVYEYTSSYQSFDLSAPFSGLSTSNDFVNATTLVDNSKFIVNGEYIEVGYDYRTDGVNVQSYMTVTGTSSISTSVTCYTSSEGGYDFGFVYMGTQLYQPDRGQITSRTTDGHGEFLYVGSDDGSNTYTYTASPGTNYFVIGYTKDGSAASGDDTLKISNISFSATSSSWVPIVQ